MKSAAYTQHSNQINSNDGGGYPYTGRTAEEDHKRVMIAAK